MRVRTQSNRRPLVIALTILAGIMFIFGVGLTNTKAHKVNDQAFPGEPGWYILPTATGDQYCSQPWTIQQMPKGEYYACITNTGISTPTPAPTEYYANCDDLRVVYPDGVDSNHQAYRVALDRDQDGTACEIDNTQPATPNIPTVISFRPYSTQPQIVCNNKTDEYQFNDDDCGAYLYVRNISSEPISVVDRMWFTIVDNYGRKFVADEVNNMANYSSDDIYCYIYQDCTTYIGVGGEIQVSVWWNNINVELSSINHLLINGVKTDTSFRPIQ